MIPTHFSIFYENLSIGPPAAHQFIELQRALLDHSIDNHTVTCYTPFESLHLGLSNVESHIDVLAQMRAQKHFL